LNVVPVGMLSVSESPAASLAPWLMTLSVYVSSWLAATPVGAVFNSWRSACPAPTVVGSFQRLLPSNASVTAVDVIVTVLVIVDDGNAEGATSASTVKVAD